MDSLREEIKSHSNKSKSAEAATDLVDLWKRLMEASFVRFTLASWSLPLGFLVTRVVLGLMGEVSFVICFLFFEYSAGFGFWCFETVCCEVLVSYWAIVKEFSFDAALATCDVVKADPCTWAKLLISCTRE